MQFARLDNENSVVEIIVAENQGDLEKKYHPDFLVRCIVCEAPPVCQGWGYDGSGFSAPIVKETSAHDAAMNELRALDAYLPRFAEDIIIAAGISETALPQIMQERLSAKRAAREVVRL